MTIDSTNNIYRIKLANYNLYLTATGTGNGADVRWQALNSANALQIWKFETPGGGGGTSKRLSMPVNVNQSIQAEPIKSSGCALCCGVDISCYYGTSPNNNVTYFRNNYWTSNGYTWESPNAVMTESAYSLSTIKAEIDAGHPVVVHATGNGTQHWVVAFGYDNNAVFYPL